ncbi:unnamed protein product [Acanthoscelides obtectus]|uniref:Uncharacterized protein n=1 Tax=Acanthoscelides obtectus TaxID=200917 RepID=A0A9P0Q2U2_ACAOB|nr:unnamed protein product [Acanthoscelides obtectus]CAK1641153.1 hypothetical protein AOBTE_LOCUS12196 [Acanthoscelides obtectus]
MAERDLFESGEHSQRSSTPLLHLPRRYIRDRSNPLEHYRDQEFQKCFRFTKDCVVHVLYPMVYLHCSKIHPILRSRDYKTLLQDRIILVYGTLLEEKEESIYSIFLSTQCFVCRASNFESSKQYC